MMWQASPRGWTRASVVRGAVAAGWPRRLTRRPRTGAPHILLIRPDHLGDVLLTTPAFAALRAALPDARLIALVGPWAAGALANNPHLDEIHITRFPGMARYPVHAQTLPRFSQHPATGNPAAIGSRGLRRAHTLPWAPYTQLVREARRLARWRVDAAVNFRPDYWWGGALLALVGIPIRAGYDRPPGSRALTHRVAWPTMPEHATQSALRLAAIAARALGAPHTADAPWIPEAHPLIFALDDAARAWADAWLARAGLPGGARPLLVHPGAGAAVKLWTAEAWARVCERLAAETGAPVVLAGSRAEAGLVAAITQAVRAPAVVVPFTEDVPLARYAGLLASARLALGVDSGALHLAAAVGTPTLRLFGPTDPTIFGPWGPSERHSVIQAAALPCVPCGRLDYRADELPAHPCVRLIHPDVVVAAALDVLRRAERQRDACDAILPDDAPPGGTATVIRSNTL